MAGLVILVAFIWLALCKGGGTMIKANDAIRTARSMLGTSYSAYDCIEFIVQIIRRSPGGIKDYRCQGTNWLWDSVNNSGKYRHLTSHQEGLAGAKPGMLAFKRYGMSDEGHVGIITADNTIIHSSSVKGMAVEERLLAANGWNMMGTHRYIEPGTAESEEPMESYKARVKLASETGKLNVRNAPTLRGDIIGHLGNGAAVEVQAEFETGWRYVVYGDSGTGYVSGEYLEKIETQATEDAPAMSTGYTTIINDETGAVVPLVGNWRVAED